MSYAKQLSLAGLAILLAAPVAAQQVYRWVDSNGKVIYSDIPPPGGPAVKPKLTDSRIESDTMSYEMKRLVASAPVTLFTTENCVELCQNARDWLKKNKIPFTETVGATAEQIADMAKKLGGEARVPSLIVGSKRSVGFDSSAWASMLEAAGYPKAR